MICDKCKHADGCPAKAEHGGAIRCSAFKPQEITNEEWLHTLTTEQLAEFLFDIGEYDWLENIADEYKKSLHLKQEVCDGIVEWLKQPHRPKE